MLSVMMFQRLADPLLLLVFLDAIHVFFFLVTALGGMTARFFDRGHDRHVLHHHHDGHLLGEYIHLCTYLLIYPIQMYVHLDIHKTYRQMHTVWYHGSAEPT